VSRHSIGLAMVAAMAFGFGGGWGPPPLRIAPPLERYDSAERQRRAAAKRARRAERNLRLRGGGE
jgi:hypothetical protein